MGHHAAQPSRSNGLLRRRFGNRGRDVAAVSDDLLVRHEHRVGEVLQQFLCVFFRRAAAGSPIRTRTDDDGLGSIVGLTLAQPKEDGDVVKCN